MQDLSYVLQNHDLHTNGVMSEPLEINTMEKCYDSSGNAYHEPAVQYGIIHDFLIRSLACTWFCTNIDYKRFTRACIR